MNNRKLSNFFTFLGILCLVIGTAYPLGYIKSPYIFFLVPISMLLFYISNKLNIKK